MGKHIQTVVKSALQKSITEAEECSKCQVSCQSACKTSCTVGSQACEK